MAIEYKRRLFTVDEYHRLAEANVLCEGDRVELIDGELIEMAPLGPLHVTRHARIARYLGEALRGRATVLPMGSFPLGAHSEPQPDLALLPFDVDSFEGRPFPPVTEFLAFVEIADSSLAYDARKKMRLYAAHGVSDYLLVDVRGNRLIAHREPSVAGYARTVDYGYGENFTLSQLPGVKLYADEFLAVLGR